jgi:flagellar basal body-associated protein FliL
VADADDKKQQEDVDDIEQQEDSKTEKNDKKVSGGILPWAIMFVVVVLFGIAGFTLGRFLTGSHTPKTDEHSQEDEPAQVEYLRAEGSATNSQRAWYYDLEPVVANLDEPGVTRYIRVFITLEISPKVDKVKGIAFFDEKRPVLTNCLNIYLASLNLDDIKGDRNLKRIQSQLLETFNEKLFPDTESQIKQILFKEFAIQ